MKLRLISSGLCLLAAVSSLAMDNVKLVTGHSYYGSMQREKGMEPPTESMLKEAAKAEALNKLGHQEDFVQITPDRMWSRCEVLYRGSPLCIQGEAQYRAAFVMKGAEQYDWYITTEGVVSSFIKDPGNSREEARERAMADAQFACGSRTMSEIRVPEVWCNEREHPEGGWCKMHYRTTFKCSL